MLSHSPTDMGGEGAAKAKSYKSESRLLLLLLGWMRPLRDQERRNIDSSFFSSPEHTHTHTHTATQIFFDDNIETGADNPRNIVDVRRTGVCVCVVMGRYFLIIGKGVGEALWGTT